MEQPFDMSNLGAMLQQIGAMMQRAEALPEGTVDWDGVRQAARTVIAQTPDPSIVTAETERVRAAADLAQLWLDATIDFPAQSVPAVAWSRSEWLEATFEGWQQVLEPIALAMERSVGDAMAQQELPEEMAMVATHMARIARRMASVMSAQQVGQALGTLARDVWSASDIGVPLTKDGRIALVTGNTRAFAEEHGLDVRDFETYLALREAAAQRLFQFAPWIGPRLRDAIGEFASGITVDADQLRTLLEGVDTADPAVLQEHLISGGMELPMTAAQSTALARIELLIALIEGWVDHITETAHGGRIGNASAIREALRRRRATGGPAERTFTQLLGLQLRPRRLREASDFWASQNPAERDGLWRHPDFLPTSLDDDGVS